MFAHGGGEAVQPCPQMRPLIGPYADGNLKGVLYRYAHAHLARCAHCQAALEAMRSLLGRLSQIGKPSAAPVATTTLPPERWEAIEQAWTVTEQRASADKKSDTG